MTVLGLTVTLCIDASAAGVRATGVRPADAYALAAGSSLG